MLVQHFFLRVYWQALLLQTIDNFYILFIMLIFHTIVLFISVTALKLSHETKLQTQLAPPGQTFVSYQYRHFERLQEEQRNFNELDLYFYKPNLLNIGVKARYDKSETLPLKWKVTKVEIKVVTNLEDIKEGKTTIEKWKKIASTNTNFEFFSRTYIEQNPEKFGVTPEHPVDSAVQQELDRVSKFITSAIRQNKEIDAKLYEKNPDLKKWVNDQQKLGDVFMIEKDRLIDSKGEKGVVRVTPLFDPGNIAPCLFHTMSFQADSQQKVEEILKKEELFLDQNTSYPKLLEKLYFNLI